MIYFLTDVGRGKIEHGSCSKRWILLAGAFFAVHLQEAYHNQITEQIGIFQKFRTIHGDFIQMRSIFVLLIDFSLLSLPAFRVDY